jgi:hypothetical protein
MFFNINFYFNKGARLKAAAIKEKSCKTGKYCEILLW